MVAQYQPLPTLALKPADKDNFTDGMSYQKVKLGSLQPGRGDGVGRRPLLRRRVDLGGGMRRGDVLRRRPLPRRSVGEDLHQLGGRRAEHRRR